MREWWAAVRKVFFTLTLPNTHTHVRVQVDRRGLNNSHTETPGLVCPVQDLGHPNAVPDWSQLSRQVKLPPYIFRR